MSPDLRFAINLLHYRLGVEALWNVMSEMKVSPDDELTFIVRPSSEKCLSYTGL